MSPSPGYSMPPIERHTVAAGEIGQGIDAMGDNEHFRQLRRSTLLSFALRRVARRCRVGISGWDIGENGSGEVGTPSLSQGKLRRTARRDKREPMVPNPGEERFKLDKKREGMARQTLLDGESALPGNKLLPAAVSLH